MIEAPTPIVIVSASVDPKDVEFSMHALRAGALAVLPKPPGPEAANFDDEARKLVDTIKAMAAVKVVRRWPGKAYRPAPVAPPPVAKLAAPPRVVAIAASTGGPAALARILSELSSDFPLPILVVQHIADGFIDGLAAWLNTTGSVRVKVAEHGELLRPHTVYLAPDRKHLRVRDGGAVALSSSAAVGGFRPSATCLFESVAGVFGRGTVAIILTGMGQDGVDGLRAVRAAGGHVVAQDQASSVVFGMPGAAVAAGLADAVLSIDEMAMRLQGLV
jgi:two-component system chemotaxis response regulator CheB